jgi:hypothetical protein
MKNKDGAKRFIYIVLCAFLGALILAFVYFFLEIAIIYLILNFFTGLLKIKYEVFNYLRFFSFFLFIISGFVAGLALDKKWWKLFS